MEINGKINRWVAISTFVLSGFVYLLTVAPDVSFWDVGEFIACSYIMGVMHPPGAPVFEIIGRIFTFFPISNIAFRVNLVSVVSSALAVMFLYLIIVRIINLFRGQPRDTRDRWMTFGSAFLGAMTFAFTDSFWFNAVEAEVYALSTLIMALGTWLVLYWGDYSEEVSRLRYLILVVYLFGLSIGVHLLSLLIFPFIVLVVHFRDNETAKRLIWTIAIQITVPVFLYILIFHYDPARFSYTEMLEHQARAGKFLMITGLITVTITLAYLYNKDKLAFRLWWIIPVLFIIGYSTYLIIYIRSGLNPPIDENDPENWQNLMAYLARKQYGENSLLLTMFARRAEFWAYQIKKMYIRYFAWQFVGKGTTLGPDGYIVETWSLRGLFMIPFTVGIVGAYYHFRRDWKHALAVLLLFIATGIAIILYLNQEDPQPRERDYAYVGSFFAFSIWIGVGVYALLESVLELIREKIPQWKPVLLTGLAVLAIALPINMLRFNYESHDRSGNFVPYDYSYNILQTCEPNAIIFTNGDNDTFPLWYLQYVNNIRPDVRLVNLSLLNTKWYIRQLRDQEPKVPISLTDEELDRLGLMPWPKPREVLIRVPKWVYEREKKDLIERDEWEEDLPEPEHLKITVRPTIGNPKQFLRIQDLMILNIIMTNQWKKPIYFAVTVSDENKVGLQRYLRMDGMAFKLVPYPDLNISPSRLHENLFEKFLFRNLNNPDVYYDDKTKGLLINYRSAFLRLADYYRRKDQKEKVLEVLDRMEYLMPEHLIPIQDPRIVLTIGKMYEDAGRPEEFERRALKVLEEHPDMIQAYAWLLDFYDRYNRPADAIALLRRWMERNPGDTQAQQMIEQLQKQLEAAVEDTIKKDSLSLPEKGSQEK